MHLPDPGAQPGSCSRRKKSAPRIPARHRRPDTCAYFGGRVSDQRIGHSGSVEEANYAAARRKLSSYLSKRRFSRRNRTNSDCSALTIPSLMPSSTSALCVQQQVVSSATPKSVGTGGVVIAPRLAQDTKSLLNSSVHLSGITTSSPQALKSAQSGSSQPNAIPYTSTFL